MPRCRTPRCHEPLEGNIVCYSPRNRERYRLWAEFVGLDTNPIKLKQFCVCEIHFEWQYLSYERGKPSRLLSGACGRPTIHCYGPDKDVAVCTITPSPASSGPPPTEGDLECDRLPSGDMQDCPDTFCVETVTVTLARSILDGSSCSNCKAMLSTDSSKDPRRRVQFQFSGDSLYPTEDFLKLVESVTAVTGKVLEESAGIGGIKARVKTISNSDINHSWVKDGCSEHFRSVFDSIVDTCCTLTMQWWAKSINGRSSHINCKNRWEEKLKILKNR